VVVMMVMTPLNGLNILLQFRKSLLGLLQIVGLERLTEGVEIGSERVLSATLLSVLGLIASRTLCTA
jgi:hypothetical protein